jgi:hypothetical protein
MWNKIPENAVVPEGQPQKGYIHVNEWTGNFFKVSVVGLGFTLMKREVLERVKELCELTNTVPFHWEKPETRSEDFDFLEKARLLGYDTWVYSDVKLSHEVHGFVDITGELRVPRV